MRGELNPADIPTRSLKDKFNEHVWKNGPKFLSSFNYSVDKTFDDETVGNAFTESKKGLSSSVTTSLLASQSLN